MRSGRLAAWGAAALVCAAMPASAAQAQDFFPQLFGGFAPPRHQPYIQMPFAGDDDRVYAPRRESRTRSYSGGGGQAYCVRTCDGRYFPVTGSDNASRAAICDKLCPASETKLYYGGGEIDDATALNGKSYSNLPNAFRYRNELVSDCTCNGKDPVGLAKIKIEDDPTVKKGDIVAGEKGLLVAGRSADKRGAELNFSPASEKLRAKYGRVPVVARE
jgi:hypothetical protein